MSIEEQIARLAAATRGSRELDAHVDVAIHNRTVVQVEGDFSLTTWHTPGRYWYDAVHFADPPPYTTSIDAALTLVPEGARVRELGQWWNVSKPGGWFCNIMRWEFDANGNPIERCYTHGLAEDDTMPDTAPTGALALCIAALRARAAAGDKP